jgi:TM2 domain-containing membrane protein YozV
MARRADPSVSPALAFFLGLIPGVGAIYNGQYAKGLVHAIVWGVLMSIANTGQPHELEPVFVMLVIAWWAYMALEAHHTARRLQNGEPVDEYSSLFNLRGGANRAPVAAIGLIVLGVLLLLHTLDLLNFEYVARFWPVLLIAAGVYLLWERFSGRDGEVRHER